MTNTKQYWNLVQLYTAAMLSNPEYANCQVDTIIRLAKETATKILEDEKSNGVV